VETDKKVAGVDKEKRILPVSRESPAHIKESKKGGGEGRCDKNVECRRRGGSTSCAIRGTALWCFVAYGCWTLRPTPGAKDEEASSIATPGPLDRLNN
jgi:hypothetical protein